MRAGARSTPRLSVCLIVRDEARMLPGCLDSVRGCADEVVVVDTGSRDGTPALALARGCRVARMAWPGSFAEARNAALALARGDWVLSIDADERLATPARLARALRGAPADVGGFLVEQHNVLRVIDTGQRDVHAAAVARLFRRAAAIRFRGAVHERIDEGVAAAGLALRPSTVALTHLTYDLDPAFVLAKQRRYLRMLHAALRRDPADAWARFQRGKTLLGMARDRDGARDLAAVAADDRAPPAVRAMALNYLGIHRAERGRVADALACADRALALAPGQSFAHLVAGEGHFRRGAWAAARAAFSRMKVAGARGERAALTGDCYLLPAQRAWHRGRCWLAAGDVARAAREFDRGLAADPDSAACHYGLAHVALARGRRAAAVRRLRAAVARDAGWTTPAALLADLTGARRAR